MSRGSSAVCSALLGGVPGGLKRPLEVLKPSPVFAPLPGAEGMLGILADQIMGSISKPPTLLNVQRIAKTVPLKSAVCPLAARIKWPWRRHLPYLGQWDPCAKNRWFHLFIPPPFFFLFSCVWPLYHLSLWKRRFRLWGDPSPAKSTCDFPSALP